MVVLQRFVFDNWVPKKLEIELQVPIENEFEHVRGNGGKPGAGEMLIPENVAQEVFGEPDLNGEILGQIIQMGVPELAAKHALHITGNNNADMAVMWYFDNMDNPGNIFVCLIFFTIALTQPLVVKKASVGGASQAASIPQELIDNLTMLGFPEKKARKALKATVLI